jgi:acetyl-CoA carboxylase biotin carboxyl carrier protein
VGDHRTDTVGTAGGGDTDPHVMLPLLRDEVCRLVTRVPGQPESVSLRVGEYALEVTWPGNGVEPQRGQAPAPAMVTSVTAVPPPAAGAPEADENIREVVAPLVGTFYVAAEPGAQPFVQKGDRVEPGQTVGIVEAMKLMNPVCSSWAGEVIEIVLGDAAPVEFGQCLVRIRVADHEDGEA